jgi:NAD(P)-dependent dehydrogenase (short-subunit alcohol dehydrogenase family)
MSDTLTGAVVLLTGANGGLGQALAAELKARNVAKLYVSARSLAAAESVASAVGGIPLQLDITDPASVAAAAATASDLTLLINNGAVNHNTALLKAPDLTIAREEMEVNYFGTLSMCRAFAPILKANGGGTIVNVLTVIARVGLPMMGSLCASKAASLIMTQCLRGELAAQGTKLIAVMPGAIDTRMTANFPPPKMPPDEAAKEILDGIVAGDEEIYVGDMARGIAAGLATDPKAVERQLSAYL